MNGTSLIVEASPWLIPVCIVAGLAYAFLLYFRDRAFSDLPAWLRRGLPILRFLLVFLLAFLLLEPLFRHFRNEEIKPILVIAHDNSRSVTSGGDSTFYLNEWPKQLNQLSGALADKFDVRHYRFAGHVEQGQDLDFSGRETNISSVFQEITTRFSNLNMGALILATDGNFNVGSNPQYNARGANYPIYTLALGDTLVSLDLSVNRVYHNRVAYLGNTFPLEVVAEAYRCDGCRSTIEIRQGNTVLAKQEVTFSGAEATRVIPFQIKASSPGHQRFTVTISQADGELTYINNRYDLFIEVLDNRQKVLILYRAPHPDVNAIRSAIAGQEGFETELFSIKDFRGNFSAYSLVIAMHLPDGPRNVQWMAGLENAPVPVWFIGPGYFPPAGWGGIDAKVNAARYNDVFPRLTPDFSLFTAGDELSRIVAELPPLSVPFGTYSSAPSALVFMSQRIGAVNTEYPLWTFLENNERKSALLAGEGIWRWRLSAYAQTGNHQVFDQLIRKTVQYLAVRTDTRRFRVNHAESFPETEKVVLDAELYNEAFEPVNDPEVRVVVTDESGKKFNYSFSRTARAYRLDAGNFAPGIYKYDASVSHNGAVLRDQGEFTVLPVNVELQRQQADHALLKQISENSGGKMFYPSGINQLENLLLNQEEMVPVIESELELQPVVEIWWIFVLLLILVSTEWFIRRRYGAY